MVRTDFIQKGTIQREPNSTVTRGVTGLYKGRTSPTSRKERECWGLQQSQAVGAYREEEGLALWVWGLRNSPSPETGPQAYALGGLHFKETALGAETGLWEVGPQLRGDLERRLSLAL